MTLPSDTPPDGDFAAYIERLTGANAQAGPREDLFRSQDGASSGTPFAASAGLPSVKTLPDAVASIAFPGHIQWLVVAWVAIHALDTYVLPGTGFLFTPLLLAYVGWVLFSINRTSSGALAKGARELAAQTIASARKLPKPHLPRKK